MSESASFRPLGSLVRACVLACVTLPLACAVAIEPELRDDQGDTAGNGGASAGKGPVIPVAGASSAGATSAFGGTTASVGGSSAGSSMTAGTSASGGKAGSAAMGGKGGGTTTGGKGGSGGAQGGTNSAGSGGHAGGSGGASNGCGALKSWKGGDSTLTIAAGEVIQWMGKRYKATASIAYPNAECAPDSPAMWCEAWFTPDGDC